MFGSSLLPYPINQCVYSHSMLRKNASKWRLGDESVKQSTSEIASKTKEVLHIKKFEKYCGNSAQEE